jgi:hypothetical protein
VWLGRFGSIVLIEAGVAVRACVLMKRPKKRLRVAERNLYSTALFLLGVIKMADKTVPFALAFLEKN